MLLLFPVQTKIKNNENKKVKWKKSLKRIKNSRNVNPTDRGGKNNVNNSEVRASQSYQTQLNISAISATLW